MEHLVRDWKSKSTFGKCASVISLLGSVPLLCVAAFSFLAFALANKALEVIGPGQGIDVLMLLMIAAAQVFAGLLAFVQGALGTFFVSAGVDEAREEAAPGFVLELCVREQYVWFLVRYVGKTPCDVESMTITLSPRWHDERPFVTRVLHQDTWLPTKTRLVPLRDGDRLVHASELVRWDTAVLEADGRNENGHGPFRDVVADMWSEGLLAAGRVPDATVVSATGTAVRLARR